MKAGPPSQVAGFTVLETLVVLAIIGIAATIATYAIGPIHDRNIVARSASDLDRLLVNARNAALVSGSPRHVDFDIGSRRFSLREERQGIVVPDAIGVNIVSASEVGATSVERQGGVALLFLPDGTGSGGTMTLRAGAASRTLHVSWLTGRISDD